MNFLRTLQWRLRRFQISNLMQYIIGGTAVVFLVDLFSRSGVSQWLQLDFSRVMRGEIWRLVTFIFIPPSTSLLWIVFALYFYWMIGSALSTQWGASRFTLFYATGMIGAIIAAAITGFGTNEFINLSLFLAFASMFPDFQVMIFFVLPVKMKYLALIDIVFLFYQLIVGTWSIRVSIIFSLLNVILFLGGDILTTLQRESQYFKTRYNFRRAMRK